MLFSVITPSLNCGELLPANIESVRNQGLGAGELEHWVIDGGSRDGTVEYLKAQSDIQWLSEKDNGLSHAVNKGIQRAKGDWILWLNADDTLAEGALRIVQRHIKQHPAIRIFAGALTYLRYDGSAEQTVPAWEYSLPQLLGQQTGINQPSTFIHREVFQKVGLLDESNHYAMDYEWMVRAMHHCKCLPVPEVLSFYRRRRGSITDAHMVKQHEEFLKIRRRYGQPVFSRAEFRIRFYIWTEPLRRICWLRPAVRRVKRLFGREPSHPYE
jgi:glycosyltransferase involved in cell wall biosynthesis